MLKDLEDQLKAEGGNVWCISGYRFILRGGAANNVDRVRWKNSARGHSKLLVLDISDQTVPHSPNRQA
jgi:hypothetical protein